MHDTAAAIGSTFLKRYSKAGHVIVELGSYNVNGSLRGDAHPQAKYIGLDVEKGPGVDRVIKPDTKLPIKRGFADIVIATSVLEHDSFFWITFLELVRITKSGGFIYINAPSNGSYHRYPSDNWRFYPDSGKMLEKWGKKKSRRNVTLIESFIAARSADQWNDFVAIFQVGRVTAPQAFLSDEFACTNVWKCGILEPLKRRDESEDMVLIAAARERILEIEALRTEINSRAAEVTALQGINKRAYEDIEAARSELGAAKVEIDALGAGHRDLEAQWHSERESYNGLAQSLNAELQSLGLRLAEQEMLAAERLAQFEDARQTIGVLTQDLEIVRKTGQSEIDAARFQIDALGASRRDIETQWQGEREVYVRELDAAREWLREAQAMAQSLAGELDAAQTALTAEKSAHAAAEGALDLERERAAQFMLEKDRLLARLDAGEALRIDEQRKSSALAAELVAMRERHALQTRRAQEQAAASAALATELAAERDRHEADARRLHGEAAAHATRADETARDLAALRVQADAIRATVAEQAAQLAAPPSLRARLARPLTGLTRRFARWKRPNFRAREWEAKAIRTSRLFSPLWYLQRHPDVAATGQDPLVHYLAHGAAEDRDPHPLFDARWYRDSYPQARAERMSPLAHYATVGVSEGLDPHPLFDTDYYIRNNPDVAIAGINPLSHYMTYGALEGRDPHPLFDSSWYLEQNPDVAKVRDNPLLHYLTHGWREERDPNPNFDSSYYLTEYHDVAAAGICPLVHYIYYGRSEGRQVLPPVTRSTQESYVPNLEVIATSNEDLIAALFDVSLYRFQVEVERGQSLNGSPLDHYLREGFRDHNLIPNAVFNPAFYIKNHNLSIQEPALLHYVRVGDRLGYATHQFFDTGLYNATRNDKGSVATAVEHFISSSDDKRHVSHRQMSRPLSADVIEFIHQLATFEDRSALALVRGDGMLIADIPLGFYFDEYRALNPDLAADYDLDFLPLFTHYIRHGRHENRMIGKWQLYIDLERYCISAPVTKLSLPKERARKGVCVLIHIFYSDLVQEIITYANSFGDDLHDVYINIVDSVWTADLYARIRNLCPGAFVITSPNTGRDIGGFIRLLEQVDTTRYEVLAFMHTKRSPHVAPEKAEYWRRTLLNAIAGSQHIAQRNVQLFRDDRTIGLLGSKEWRGTDLAKNSAQFERMLDLFEIQDQNRGVEYLSGTMFLMRPGIADRLHEILKDVALESGDGRTLDFNMDGQVAHAIERVIGNVVRQLGYRIEWVAP